MQDSPGTAEDRLGELDRTRLRIEEIRRRSAELEQRNQELARHEPPGGFPLENVQRAADRAEEAIAKAAEAQTRAAAATRRSAAAHEAAARRHEQLASTGFGDAEEHRLRAREHYVMSEVDLRVAASQWPQSSQEPASPRGPGSSREPASPPGSALSPGADGET